MLLFLLYMLHMYQLLYVILLLVIKCHHCCSINVAVTVCTAVTTIIMLLSLCVNVAYVSVIVCDVTASKCCRCYGVNITVTVCSAAYVAPPFPVKACGSIYLFIECDSI